LIEQVVRQLSEPDPEQPDAQRREVLEQALRFYEGLRAEGAREQAGGRQEAQAGLRTVPLHLALGQEDAAEKAARRALALFEELAKRGQPGDGLRLEQAQAHAALAAVLQSRDRPADALAQVRPSRELLAALVKDEEDPRRQETMADACEQ